MLTYLNAGNQPERVLVQDDIGAFESFSAADAEGKSAPPQQDETKESPKAKEQPKQDAAPKATKQESQQPAPSKPSGQSHISLFQHASASDMPLFHLMTARCNLAQCLLHLADTLSHDQTII